MKCNKCLVDKNVDAFNASDISQRRYICKLCKKEQRAEWKRNRQIADSVFRCLICGEVKPTSEFIESDLRNSTHYCRHCHASANQLNIIKKQNEQH
jgi:hypothetical protein